MSRALPWGAFGDVEQDDVAQRFARGHVGQGSADHSGADKGDLRASHSGLSSRCCVCETVLDGTAV